MVAYYPNATPEQWILPENLKTKKTKVISSSSNDTAISCRMRYAQFVKANTPMVLATGSVPKAKCMGLVY